MSHIKLSVIRAHLKPLVAQYNVALVHFVVARICGNLDNSCHTGMINGVKTKTCGCTGDFCNSANSASFSVMVLVASAFVSKIFS